MSSNTKTLLIVGSVAVGAYLLYNYMRNRPNNPARNNTGTTSQSSNSNTGGNWWDKIGQYADTVLGTAKSVENTYNTVANV